MLIDKQYLQNLKVGAAILGTGGGGSPTIGYLMAMQAIEEYGPVKLIKIEDLTDSDYACSIAGIGSPGVSIEKIPNGQEFTLVIKELEKATNKKITALFAIEAGGSNSMLPIIAAAKLGIPLVDCDMMGRAFPKVQMITPTIFKYKNTPICLVNERLESIVVNCEDPNQMEKYCRSISMTFGGKAVSAMCICNKQQLQQFAIQDIITKSHDIGRIVNESDNALNELIKTQDAYHLFDGKITDVNRYYKDGFSQGEITVRSFEGNDTLKIIIQNENLVALLNNELICIVPDLICILDFQTLDPITTEMLKFAMRITVIGFKADEKWRTINGLNVAGPSCFGLNYKFETIENLNNI